MVRITGWLGISVVLAAVSAQASARSAAVGLKGNTAQFFSADDYPPEALRLRQEGRVVAKLWVDITGKVASCTVTQSSGSPSLDQRTCEIALAKIVYEPALDRRGRPIAASTVLPVRWVLPHGAIDIAQNPPPPRWTMDMTFSIDSAGIVQACHATMVPTAPVRRDPCDEFPVGKQTETHWTRDGRPVGGTITRHASEEITIDP